ncbi:MAG: dephospho-CoA kinase, partial [Thermoanaerobaculia bacterium]
MLRVGLTGGIASGKSTVRRILDRLGCATLDADALVSELYLPGRAGHSALVREYGKEILDASGEVDRTKLSAIAFASPEAARRLNELVHPIVLLETARIGAGHE